MFDQFDTANNGVISYEEFHEAMNKMNYPKKEINSIFKSIVSFIVDSILDVGSIPNNVRCLCRM